jgi:uncharacterized protein (TIGR00369 family)
MEGTPTRIADLLRQVRQTGDYRLLTEVSPYTRFLGIAMENTTGEVLCRMRYAPMLIGNSSIPALHGGTLGALLESAAIFELLLRTQEERVPKIISITVDFLRSGRTQDTLAKATITRLGRRVANLQVQAWQEDRSKPIASANALFLLS